MDELFIPVFWGSWTSGIGAGRVRFFSQLYKVVDCQLLMYSINFNLILQPSLQLLILTTYIGESLG